MGYGEKLKDPRWQKKRLKILVRDEWTCQVCFDDKSSLSVHHCYYEKGKDPWDYPDEALVTLCEDCHSEEWANRRSYEKSLLDTLKRKRFTASDISDLAIAFHLMATPPFPTSGIINAIGWILKDRDRIKKMIALHHKWWRSHHKGNETSEDTGVDNV